VKHCSELIYIPDDKRAILALDDSWPGETIELASKRSGFGERFAPASMLRS
jgi:hypothetical protein